MSTQPRRSAVGPGNRAALQLEFPMSLGVYDTYPEAQRSVDYLSDNGFPVQDVLVVGTDLKSMERVTGRLTRGRVIGAGALSGAWLGFFVGLIFALFDPQGFQPGLILSTVLFGAAFGAVWALVGYALTKGQRDFTSVSQIVATKYEVLTEHKHAMQGRELLSRMDPMKAAQEQVRLTQEAQRAAAAPAGHAPPPGGYAPPPSGGQPPQYSGQQPGQPAYPYGQPGSGQPPAGYGPPQPGQPQPGQPQPGQPSEPVSSGRPDQHGQSDSPASSGSTQYPRPTDPPAQG